jgi:hypothetical protein
VLRAVGSGTISSLVTGDRKNPSGYETSIYSRGDLSTASTELPMFVPIEEKKLLNLSEISFASVVSKLSSFNFVGIPCVPLLFKLTISFIPDQIFFKLQELLLK